MIRSISASVTGCSGPFSTAERSIFFASGESTPMPIPNVAA